MRFDGNLTLTLTWALTLTRASTQAAALAVVLCWVGMTGCVGGSNAAPNDAPTEQAESTGSSKAPAPISDPPPALVEVRSVIAAGAGSSLWVTGTLLSRFDAGIAAELAGRLVSVAEVGDRLAEGETIAQLDHGSLDIQLRADEAEIRRLEVRLDYLGKQAQRVKALAEQEIAATYQLDDLDSQRAMAEQDLEAARIERDRTRYLLGLTILKAPFSGRLVERLAQPGDYVTVGEQVARLVDVDRTEVQARAPLALAPWIQEGMEVQIQGGGFESIGRVRAAVPVGDERSRMFEIRLEVSNVPWPVGAALKVLLPQGGQAEAGAVQIPRDALILRRDATYVFVVEEGIARRVDVVAGAGDGDWIEAQGNLQVGARVVIRGGERLQSGQNVELVGEDR